MKRRQDRVRHAPAHPTKEQRDAGIGFGAVELGYQTLGKLARHLGAS